MEIDGDNDKMADENGNPVSFFVVLFFASDCSIVVKVLKKCA